MNKQWQALLCGSALAIFTVACAETDPGITTAVKTKFAADATVKAYQINVDTRDGVVTLSGNVENAAAKTTAVRLARETDGVTNVVDNVMVAAKPLDTPNIADRVDRTDATDPGITALVKSKLLADPDTSGLKIDVDTQNGVVTLSGRVATAAEKNEAVRMARDSAGVKSVNDKLTVGR